MAEKIRVMVLEDHQGSVDGYRYRLDSESDIEVAATAVYGVELEATIAANQPIHVAILDIHVPNAATDQERYPILHVIPKLLQQYPDLKIVTISVFKQAALIKAVMDAGASGYILKDDRETHCNLASVVRGVAAGGVHMSKEAYEQFRRKVAQKSQLSSKQEQILYLCASHPGWSSAEIGNELGLSSATVRNVLSQIYTKLGVDNRTAAIEKAKEVGLIPPADSLRL
jgi:DNA-binding NarL/FixJ family response regulator